MPDIDSTLNALQAKNSQLQSDHARTMAQIEINKQLYLDSIDDLKELGCDSIEQAEEVIAQLSKEIRDQIEDIVEGLQ